MPRPPTIPPALQRGPFSIAEAQLQGLSRHHLRSRCWRRLAPGVYCWAGWGADDDPALAALALRLPPGAAFSGPTAAILHGIQLLPETSRHPEITVPLSANRSRIAGATVRRRPLPPTDLTHRRRLPLTTPLRTLTDLASTLHRTEIIAALDSALHQRLTTVDALTAHLAANPGARGTARLRAALPLTDPRAESPMETRLRLLLHDAHLPQPQSQPTLHDAQGRFLARPDFLYPRSRLVLEYDGSTHRDSLAADNRRQNRLVHAGYRLLRFTAGDIYSNPDLVTAQVKAALEVSM